MKHFHFLFFAGFIIVSMTAADVTARSYKKVDSQGIANMIFASAPIGKGKEGRVRLKTRFTSRDKIYARSYFPRAIGRFSRGEKCHVHLWLDGKVVWRGVYSGRTLPNSSWDQIQLYIKKTGDDDFKGGMSRALGRASSGSHQVQIVILRDKLMKYKYIKKGNRVTKEPVYKPVYLSKGKFTYIAQ